MAHNQFSSVLRTLGLDLQAMNPLMGAATAGALGLGAGIAAIGAASVGLATSFDQQMARIGGLTDTTAQQLAFYKQKLLELSPMLDLTATNAAKA